MATATELLAALTNSGDDGILVIDNNLRTIHIPKSVALLGVESDDEVHRLQFTMPRYCSDIDLSTFNIRINYMNANKEGDIYVVTDKNVLASSITFSWLVGRNALAYKGNVKFIVCLKESTADGEVLREFNTTIATLPVLEGLEVDPSYLEGELSDVLEQLQSLTVAKVNEIEEEGIAQIAKVQEESAKQQNNITTKGEQVLGTIPQEYKTTVELANEGAHTKADAISRTFLGSNITVHDASDDNVRSLRLLGATTLITTTGKNLFGGDALADKLVEVSSTTMDDIAGTVTFAASDIQNKLIFSVPDQNKQYTIILYGKNTNGSNNGTNVAWQYSDGTLGQFSFNITGSLSYAIGVSDASKQVVGLYGYYNSQSTILYYDKCGIFEGVVTEADFEPYTGGKATPSYNYPQELVIPCTNGSVDITVRDLGKNLFGGNFLADKLVEVASATKDEANGTVKYHSTSVNGKLIFKVPDQNKRYTVILYGRNTSTSLPRTNLQWYYSDGSNTAMNFKTTGALSYCVVTSSSSKKLVGLYGIASTDYTTLYYDKCGIFEGVLTEADFEPCIGSTITAQTPNGLPGIAVTSGGNYIDENGQRWVCDEVDFARGVRITRLAELVFDGVTSGKKIVSTDPSQLEASKTSLYAYMNQGYINPPASNSTKIYANYSGVSLSSAIAITRTKTWLGLPQGETLTVDQVASAFNLKLKELYDAGKPLRVLYQRKTPIETPLTEAELTAYAKFRTVKPGTTIYNDSNVKMEVEYNLDTEIAVDNKILVVDNKIDKSARETSRLCAPVITSEASGDIISVSDASDWYVSGLTLCGKTTQDGTPTPDAPVELVNIATGDSIGVTVTGKNLFSGKVLNGYMMSGSWNSDSKNRTVYIPCRPSTYYTITKTPGTRFLAACVTNLPSATGDTITWIAENSSGGTLTCKTTATAKYLLVWVYNSNTDTSITSTEMVNSVQIEIGETATPYEPYNGQTLSVPTPNGLSGIAVTEGGNYTDENGQQWICDEIDLARGVHVKRIGTITFNGTESWKKTNNTEHTFHINMNTMVRFSEAPAYCTHFVHNTLPNVDGAFRKADTCYFCYSSVTTLDEWTTWLAENPISLYYVRTEPIETPLSAEEFAAYADLHTNKPSTTVYNDSGAGMKLTYAVDTKTYINNAIASAVAALAQATE